MKNCIESFIPYLPLNGFILRSYLVNIFSYLLCMLFIYVCVYVYLCVYVHVKSIWVSAEAIRRHQISGLELRVAVIYMRSTELRSLEKQQVLLTAESSFLYLSSAILLPPPGVNIFNQFLLFY